MAVRVDGAGVVLFFGNHKAVEWIATAHSQINYVLFVNSLPPTVGQIQFHAQGLRRGLLLAVAFQTVGGRKDQTADCI